MDRFWERPRTGAAVRVMAAASILIAAICVWFFLDGEPGLKSGSLSSSVAIISFGLASLLVSVEFKADTKQRLSYLFLYLAMSSIVFSPILNKYHGLPIEATIGAGIVLILLSFIVLVFAKRDASAG